MTNAQETTGRRRKKVDYVQIHNSMFTDTRLSWKAKGILGYLLSKPDGWKVKTADLMKQSTDGEKSVRSGIKELRDNGYLRSIRLKNELGKFVGIVWEYDDVPFFEVGEAETVEPVVPNPQCPKQAEWKKDGVEKGTGISNKDFSNKDFSNKELEEEEELLTLADVQSFSSLKILEREITNQKTIKAINDAITKCKAIGTSNRESMENYVVKVVEEKMSLLGQKQRVMKTIKQSTKQSKTVRSEMIPDFVKDIDPNEAYGQVAATPSTEDEERRRIAEIKAKFAK